MFHHKFVFFIEEEVNILTHSFQVKLGFPGQFSLSQTWVSIA